MLMVSSRTKYKTDKLRAMVTLFPHIYVSLSVNSVGVVKIACTLYAVQVEHRIQD